MRLQGLAPSTGYREKSKSRSFGFAQEAKCGEANTFGRVDWEGAGVPKFENPDDGVYSPRQAQRNPPKNRYTGNDLRVFTVLGVAVFRDSAISTSALSGIYALGIVLRLA